MSSHATTPSVEVMVHPIEDEFDDVDTIGVAQGVLDDLRHTIVNEDGYKVREVPSTTRSGELVEFLRDVTQAAYNHRSELIALLSTIVSTLTALSRQRRIDEIEVTSGDRKFVIKGADARRAQQMVKEFVDQTPEAQLQQTRVTAKVSKRRR